MQTFKEFINESAQKRRKKRQERIAKLGYPPIKRKAKRQGYNMNRILAKKEVAYAAGAVAEDVE